MTVVVSDAFNRTNSTTTLGSADTGQSWVATVGTWGINTNQAYSATANDGDIALIESGVSVHQVQADLTYVSTANGGDACLLGQATDGTNFYLVQNGGPSGSLALDLYKCVTGSFTLLATTGVAATPSTIAVKCQGGAQTVYVAGVSTLTASDSAVSAGTKAGLRFGGATDHQANRWDNFTIDDLTVLKPVYQNPVYRM